MSELEFNSQDDRVEYFITSGKKAGRIYFCNKKFDQGEMRLYLGTELEDWEYSGGAPELTPLELKIELDKIADERMEQLVNFVIQNEKNTPLCILKMENGMVEIRERIEGDKFEAAEGDSDTDIGSLPEF